MENHSQKKKHGQITINEMATFCKRKGFVYPSGEIYGGLAGFYDFGHLGVELKNNIKKEWWKTFVQQREDIVGMDGSIITNPKVWKASGHIDGFTDFLVDCTKCASRFRADQLIEDKLKIETAGMSIEDISGTLAKHNIKCAKCGGALGNPRRFNLMFATNIGPVQGDNSMAYLRPETAQLIFADFRLVQENARLKLPFGIAQVGKSFRNEISPRDFLFRMREFEQMEIEYFVHPKKQDECPFLDEVADHEIIIYSANMQSGKGEPHKMKIRDAISKGIIKTRWHAYWLASMHKWFVSLGANPDNFRIRQHVKDELSHYAIDTWDLEYKFQFGWKELQGLSNRTDFDLKRHIEHSNSDLSMFDEESKEKILPHVICEPSQGVERAFLVFMFDAYNYDEKRENIVLRLHPKLSPVKIGVFPLLSNKTELTEKAREVCRLLGKEWACFYDAGGTIGRRYSRQDEIGTPICVTIDFQTLEDSTVTLRDRDTTKQIRVPVGELKGAIARLMNGHEPI